MLRKIFILGGSYLQLDLILEAKKMFFYTIVLDIDSKCIGSKWCDEFLPIDIADKELVLQKAKQYKIDAILTSATELGNITVCYVGEKLGLNTNSYQTALNTTNKLLMKKILAQNGIKIAKYQLVKNEKDIYKWHIFPCIVKPIDSSAGRGISYCNFKDELFKAFKKAQIYSKDKAVLIEEYIKGRQYSCETISSNTNHQLIAIDTEYIHTPPHIMEISHTIPTNISNSLRDKIYNTAIKVLNAFHIKYGAAHIELRVTDKDDIFIIELATRTGGMRTEMINLAYGISYSQLLLQSALNILKPNITPSITRKVKCNFIISYEAYKEYLSLKEDDKYIIFEPFEIPKVEEGFIAENIGVSKGYYYVLGKK